MIASWIVATHYRPQLIRAALASIAAQRYPDGWTGQVVVVCHIDDHAGFDVARAFNAGGITILTDAQSGAGKRNQALRYATGELVLVADDDDYQHPDRARRAIEAYAAGAPISELREFRYVHLETGNVVRWCGRGERGVPPVAVGTARNYRRSVLDRVGGWKLLPRLIEKDIQRRISAKMPGAAGRAKDLGTDLSSGTICVQHGANVWDDRPEVPRGDVVRRGEFFLRGEGHWSEIPDFPEDAARLLELPYARR